MEDPSEPQWQALSARQRRVVGVLIEKAKTTPDAYPMTINALTNGCNQKSNRSPQMNLDADDVEDILEQLRELGAVGEVHGDGRVTKYRHYMKDWLGCEGNELAVMAELLLRGAQTLGELRGRAARMGKIPDIGALRPLVEQLQRKKLVIPLTSPGRGQIVSHGLYHQTELENLIRKFGDSASISSAGKSDPAQESLPSSATEEPVNSQTNTSKELSNEDSPLVQELKQEIEELRTELGKLKKDVEDIWSNLG